MKKTPPRVNGLVVQFRRKLHTAGFEMFTIETLPSGETLYRRGRSLCTPVSAARWETSALVSMLA